MTDTNKPLFEVNNLACSYPESAVDVLRVKNLNINKGSVVFLLGASGFGKSTFLETLGLMNNTIREGSIKFNPTDAPSSELADLWQSNSNDLVEIRKKHFGFIFQNTNLMDNLTAEENVILSGLIKEDNVYQDFQDDTLQLFKKIGLDNTSFNKNSLPSRLSGGQRQRLAFTRAMISKCDIIFGDEPTGNLDLTTARQLMTVLRSEVHNAGKTAVIVSHDIDLAIEFADQIIILTKDPENDIGEIRDENVLMRNEWENSEAAFRKRVEELYTVEESKEKLITQDQEKPSKFKKANFNKLYFTKEYSSILGNKKSHLWLLCLVLTLTFITTGLANGSLRYLDKKLNSAFVNWVNINIPSGRSSSGDDQKIIKKLNDDYSLKKEYDYSRIIPYKQLYFWIYNNTSKSYVLRSGRSVIPNKDKDLIENDILSSNNFIRGQQTSFSNDQSLSIIVTEKMLKELGYDPATATQIDIRYKYYTDQLRENADIYQIPISIRSIVKEIPGNNEFICTQYFINAWNQDRGNSFNLNKKTKNVIINFPNLTIKDGQEVKSKISEFVSTSDYLTAYSPFVDPFYVNTDGMGLGINLKIDFEPPLPSKDMADSVYNAINQIANVKDQKNVTRLYDYGNVNNKFLESGNDFYSVYFHSLDKIRPFSDYIYQEFNTPGSSDKIQLDISKIKDKENFNFMSGLTKTLALFLIILGIISSGLLIFNMLKLHFNKIKPNIGTLNAIGLDSKRIRHLYSLIVLRFALISLVISISAAYIIGLIINMAMKNILVIEDNLNYFTLSSFTTVICIVSIIICAYAVALFTTRKYLNKPPGNLIYNRE